MQRSSAVYLNVKLISVLFPPAIISPILAAGAVAIGVPFLLAYVYGIVPITLCRSKAQVNSSTEQPMRNSLNEEEAQAFLKQLSEKGNRPVGYRPW